MSLLDDWIDFCTGKTVFPADYFANLFRQHNHPSEVERIFAFADHGDLASERLVRFFGDTVAPSYRLRRPENRASRGEVVPHFQSFKVEAVTLLKDHAFRDLSAEIVGLSDRLVDDPIIVQENLSKTDIVHADYVDAVSDIFRDSYIVDWKFAYELKEAIFQLSTNLDVTRYLMSPLTTLPNSFEHAYQFWRRGGLYCFMDNEAQVSIMSL